MRIALEVQVNGKKDEKLSNQFMKGLEEFINEQKTKAVKPTVNQFNSTHFQKLM